MVAPLIAIVDDDPAFLSMIRTLLEGEGYQVNAHDSGFTAYQWIRTLSPDLVILDLRMEEIDSGWKVLDELQADPATKNISTIVCSADTAQLRQREQFLQSLGIESLPRPFNLDQLLIMICKSVGCAPFTKRLDQQ